MTSKVNLMVDYEDEADWFQDNIIIENVTLGRKHEDLIVELEQAVYDGTRERYAPPSSHIRIVGYAPADSDVTVKKGLNFWTHEDNIFAN